MVPTATVRSKFTVSQDDERLTLRGEPGWTNTDFTDAIRRAGYDPDRPFDEQFTDWTVGLSSSGVEVWIFYK